MISQDEVTVLSSDGDGHDALVAKVVEALEALEIVYDPPFMSQEYPRGMYVNEGGDGDDMKTDVVTLANMTSSLARCLGVPAARGDLAGTLKACCSHIVHCLGKHVSKEAVTRHTGGDSSEEVTLEVGARTLS